MNLSKFKIWESLYEELQTKESILNKIKKVLGDVYFIPKFTIVRKIGEPEDQTVYLFTDKETIHSIRVNFANDTTLYSIDFYLPNSNKPESTLYVKNQNLDILIASLPKLMKNPKPGTLIKEEEEQLLEPPVLEKPAEIESEKTGNKKIDNIDKGLDKYIYGDPKTIFEDLRSYTKMIIKGIHSSLLITGSPGVGKTYAVDDEIKKAGLIKDKEWVKIKGKTTAAGMYISLYTNNGKLIIFDDCDSIFKDDNALNILKGALDSSEDEREISWGSAVKLKDPYTGDLIPSKFKFNGKVIFISNRKQKSIDEAIKSRAFVIEVALSTADMVQYVKNLLPKIMPDEPMSIKKIAMDTITKLSRENKDVQLNLRTLEESIKILNNVDKLVDAERMIDQQCSYR